MDLEDIPTFITQYRAPTLRPAAIVASAQRCGKPRVILENAQRRLAQVRYSMAQLRNEEAALAEFVKTFHELSAGKK